MFAPYRYSILADAVEEEGLSLLLTDIPFLQMRLRMKVCVCSLQIFHSCRCG